MKSFQTTVMAIALILLIIILTSLALLLRNSRAELIYPPIISNCPINYIIDSDNNCNRTMNKALDDDTCNSINLTDFNKKTFEEKKKWMNEFCPDVTWDGLTNVDFGTKKGETYSGKDLKFNKKYLIIILLIIAIFGYFIFF